MNLSAVKGVLVFSLMMLAGRSVMDGHEVITTRLTWSEQVSRVIHRRCVSCHQEGGSAPMPLETYAQVRPWAAAIKNLVLERRMPPWDAVKGFGVFRNDLSMSQADIAVVSSWVGGGAPEGDPRYLPNIQEYTAATPAQATKGRAISLLGDTRLSESVKALAIRPEGLAAGATLQAIAHRPDGSVEHLMWIRNFNPKHNRDYVFRQPINLPEGTRIVLTPTGDSARLIIDAN